MPYGKLSVALSMVVAASAAAAAQDGGMPSGAPAAEPQARYCLRVEPNTGSRIETVRCETRAEWAQLGVDIDREWSREGVRVISQAG
jgi:hypothetical protein